jgi:hypothetical protein
MTLGRVSNGIRHHGSHRASILPLAQVMEWVEQIRECTVNACVGGGGEDGVERDVHAPDHPQPSYRPMVTRGGMGGGGG